MFRILSKMLEHWILLPIVAAVGFIWCAVLIIPCEILGLLIWLSERRRVTSSNEPNIFPYIPFIILIAVVEKCTPHRYAIFVTVVGITSGWIKLQEDSFENATIVPLTGNDDFVTFERRDDAEAARQRLDKLFSRVHEREFCVREVRLRRK